MERKIHSFKIKDIWWADEPYDVSGCDGVTFHACKNKVETELRIGDATNDLPKGFDVCVTLGVFEYFKDHDSIREYVCFD